MLDLDTSRVYEAADTDLGDSWTACAVVPEDRVVTVDDDEFPEELRGVPFN